LKQVSSIESQKLVPVSRNFGIDQSVHFIIWC